MMQNYTEHRLYKDTQHVTAAAWASPGSDTINDTIEEFNVDSKAECDQLNLAVSSTRN